MSDKNSGEFYVGYQPHAPRGITIILRRVVLALVVTAVLVAVVLTFGQGKLPKSVFEYGQIRDFEGMIRERPVPVLAVARPFAAETSTGESRYALVSQGKHGAAGDVMGFDGRRVKLRGSLIYRDGVAMIELVNGSIEVIPSESGPKKPPKRDWLGVQTIVGEIVDSKCYLGVMNPATQYSSSRMCCEMYQRRGTCLVHRAGISKVPQRLFG